MTKKQSNLAVSVPTKGDTLEQRLMKSNLSDDDKIEIIKKINEKSYYYPVYVPNNPPLNTPGIIYCTNTANNSTETTTGTIGQVSVKC